MRRIYLFFFLFTPALWAFDFRCQMPGLSLSSAPWEPSPDFMTLNFTGTRAKQEFKGIGNPDAQFFSVILRTEWCRPLETAILCETPYSALAEIESSESPTAPKTKTTFRYFITILDYREDGWAFMKVRAQRMDSNPPITFHTEFPVDSCEVNS